MGMLLSRDPEHQNTRINFSSPREGEEEKKENSGTVTPKLSEIIISAFQQ